MVSYLNVGLRDRYRYSKEYKSAGSRQHHKAKKKSGKMMEKRSQKPEISGRRQRCDKQVLKSVCEDKAGFL